MGNAKKDCTSALCTAIEIYFKPRNVSQVDNLVWTTAPVPEWNGPNNDDELINIALRSKSAASVFGNSPAFSDLWFSNENVLSKAYPPKNNYDPFDRSSADFALCLHLAFWTGKNCERMDRLYRKSQLYLGDSNA